MIDQVKELFKEYELCFEYGSGSIYYKIGDEITLNIGFKINPYSFYDFSLFYNDNNFDDLKIIYRSSHYQSSELFYDEIIIFKELILPKYLL